MPAAQQQTMRGGSGTREGPAELVLELPAPPSVNRTMGTKLGSLHPLVKAWRRTADAHLLVTKQSKHLRLIEGTVFITIIWDISNLADIDNRIKHLLDYLQLLGIVTNDNKIRSMYVAEGRAPAGCRVTVRRT
jgi:Holliday junction resolvase RusA-like endonuclease